MLRTAYLYPATLNTGFRKTSIHRKVEKVGVSNDFVAAFVPALATLP